MHECISYLQLTYLMLIPMYAPEPPAPGPDKAVSSPSITGQDTALAADERRDEGAPMELLRLLESLNSCQKRSVSSALAVTTVVPSGDFAM